MPYLILDDEEQLLGMVPHKMPIVTIFGHWEKKNCVTETWHNLLFAVVLNKDK